MCIRDSLNPNKECCPVGRLGKTLTSQHLGKLLGSQLLGKPLRYNTFGMLLLLLSQLLDKLWSQVSSLLPPGTCLQFLSRIGFSIPTARRLSSNFANSRFRAFRAEKNVHKVLFLFFWEPDGMRTPVLIRYVVVFEANR